MAFTGSNWGRRVLLTGLSPSATLLGFVALISLDNVPVEAIDAGSNSALNGGGDLRFSTDDAGVNQLPLEVVSYVTDATEGNRSCQLWVRFPSYASGTREVYMFYSKAGEVQPAVGAAFGRNEVNQDFDSRFNLETLVDSAGNASDLTVVSATKRTNGQIGADYEADPSGSYVYTDTVGLVEDDSFNMSYWFEAHEDGLPLNAFVLGVANSGNAFDNYSLNLSREGSNLFVGNFDRTTSPTVLFPITIPSVSTGDRVYISVNQSSSGSDIVAIHDGTVYTATNNRHLQGSGFNRFSLGALLDSSPSFTINAYLDEPRITNAGTTSSQDLIESEYDNQFSPVTFWTTGTPDTPSGGISVTDTSNNSSSPSNTDSVLLVGAVEVNDETNNTSSISTEDSIQFISSVIISDENNNSQSLSNSDGVLLVGAFNVLDGVDNSSSLSNLDSISFTSAIIVSDQPSNSDSVSNLDGVLLVGQVIINDENNNSESLSTTDIIVFAGAVNISDTSNNTQSLSLFDSIQIGEFSFEVNSETNIEGQFLGRSINGQHLERNINGVHLLTNLNG